MSENPYNGQITVQAINVMIAPIIRVNSMAFLIIDIARVVSGAPVVAIRQQRYGFASIVGEISFNRLSYTERSISHL